MVDQKDLMERIRAYRFALIDLGLFMDSHPTDEDAMKLRAIYKDKLQKLMDEYEKSYGNLVLTQQDVNDSWKEWINDPWPWEPMKKGGK